MINALYLIIGVVLVILSLSIFIYTIKKKNRYINFCTNAKLIKIKENS